MSGCLKEANVYGVRVPGSCPEAVKEINPFCNRLISKSQLLCLFGNAGHEGRIGMAAVTVREGEQFDRYRTYNHVVSYLPSYARPRFIRIRVIPVHTHTHYCVLYHVFEARFIIFASRMSWRWREPSNRWRWSWWRRALTQHLFRTLFTSSMSGRRATPRWRLISTAVFYREVSNYDCSGCIPAFKIAF